MLEKKCWSSEEQDAQKSEYCCFFLHKLWTYISQTKNFKETAKILIITDKYTFS